MVNKQTDVATLRAGPLSHGETQKLGMLESYVIVFLQYEDVRQHILFFLRLIETTYNIKIICKTSYESRFLCYLILKMIWT